tara:strand:- start:227 stop:976 length:750 start_codon:yes stop_codon:yes gene_type:complete
MLRSSQNLKKKSNRKANLNRMKRFLEQYEERKKARTFDASNPPVGYMSNDPDDDEYIATVRAALTHGKTLSWIDRDYYNECLAKKKCDQLLVAFDRLLDPFEMYFMDAGGIPRRVWVSMVHDCPPCVLRVIEDTCSAFGRFSDWRWQKGDRPPENWKDNRQAIEDEWPLRKQLMTHLNDRLMDFCVNSSAGEIVEWYKHEAALRWKKVRSYVEKRSLIKYWIHTANKPGSAGHLNGIRFVQNMSNDDTV